MVASRRNMSNLWCNPAKIVYELSNINRLFRSKRLPRQRKLAHHAIQVFPQLYSYSCTASVLQSSLQFAGALPPSHDEAVEMLKCNPDGAYLRKVAMFLRKRANATTKALNGISEIRSALRKGGIVISSDDVRYGEPHAIIIIGQTRCGFYIADSNHPKIRWVRTHYLRQSSDEHIAVFSEDGIYNQYNYYNERRPGEIAKESPPSQRKKRSRRKIHKRQGEPPTRHNRCARRLARWVFTLVTSLSLTTRTLRRCFARLRLLCQTS